MNVRCSKCDDPIDPMALVAALPGNYTCACGNSRGPDAIKLILSRLLNSQTVDDAKRVLTASLDRGVTCPVCAQYARTYYRRMSAIIARWLIAFARASEGDRTKWVHVRECGKIMGGDSTAARSGDYAKARWWGLVESNGDVEDEDKKSSGLWRLTAAGWDFVAMKTAVHESAVVYNNVVSKLTGPMVSISAALGKKFSYKDLIGPLRVQPAASLI